MNNYQPYFQPSYPYNNAQQYPSYPQQPAHMQQRDPWTVVQTIAQIEQVAVQPGQVAWIMCQNEPVFARRAADSMGLISTEYCRFERFDPKAAQAAPPVEYVTREEFQRFVAEMKKGAIVNE